MREQLDREKQAYRSARYAGDLAADVMPRRSSSWWIGALGAVAAAIIVAVDLWSRTPTAPVKISPPVALLVTTAHSPEATPLWSPPTIPAVSVSDVGSAPQLGGMPSFPSFSDSSPQQE